MQTRETGRLIIRPLAIDDWPELATLREKKGKPRYQLPGTPYQRAVRPRPCTVTRADVFGRAPDANPSGPTTAQAGC